MLLQEWNYYTRRDAQVNYSIATATRMDSSQMKQISLLGMIYLPGTFLAVSYLPRNFGTAAHPHPDLLLNDIFQLDSRRKCSNDLTMARSLCGTYCAANLGDYNLV